MLFKRKKKNLWTFSVFFPFAISFLFVKIFLLEGCLRWKTIDFSSWRIFFSVERWKSVCWVLLRIELKIEITFCFENFFDYWVVVQILEKSRLLPWTYLILNIEWIYFTEGILTFYFCTLHRMCLRLNPLQNNPVTSFRVKKIGHIKLVFWVVKIIAKINLARKRSTIPP